MVRAGERLLQGTAIAAVGVPGALLAHLLATGSTAPAGAALLVTAAIIATAAALPARSASGLAAVTGTAQIVAQTVLATTPATTPNASPACIPAVGRAATLGVHLAVLQADGHCPAGTLAVTDLAGAALTAALAAFAIITGHLLVALLTGLLLGRAFATRDLLAGVTGLLGHILTRTAALLTWVLPAPQAQTRVRRPHHTTTRHRPAAWWPGVPVWRGPPAGVLPAH